MNLRFVALLRSQARSCARLGSPMYAELLNRAAEDGDVVGPVLAGHENDPPDSALALRLLGAVHRLVLEGRAPLLAAYYPTAGGDREPVDAWPEFRRVLATRASEIRGMLDGHPQTNEVGRSAPLLGGLLHVAAATRRSIRLLEIGASAGLNLRADRFRYVFGPAGAFGPSDSPVVLGDAWRPGGAWPPLGVTPDIVERTGCDVAPVDPGSAQGRLRLTAYVWPDQAERLWRLRGALDVAARVPASLVRASAVDFLRDQLLERPPVPGVATVVWHSVMWQYMPQDERAAIEEIVGRAGIAATEESPIAHLAFEPTSIYQSHAIRASRAFFAVTLRLWPRRRVEGRSGGAAEKSVITAARRAHGGYGTLRLLGEAPAHGTPVAWYGSTDRPEARAMDSAPERRADG